VFGLDTRAPQEVQVNAFVEDPERIRAHVRFLASDLLEGRGTGQRGGDIAAEYIATQFALSGLRPAGDNGTYFQDVPLVGIRTLEKCSQTPDLANRKPLQQKPKHHKP
jgi:hypothetical protein